VQPVENVPQRTNPKGVECLTNGRERPYNQSVK